MPARSSYIEPSTGDHVLERGSPRADTTIVSSAIIRLRMRRGSCAVDPRLGSRLHTLDKVNAQTGRLGSDYVREALADLVERGDMRQLAVAFTQPNAYTILFDISFRDTAGRARSVLYTHRVT